MNKMHRRTFLRKLGAGTAVALAAPVALLSLPSVAQAQTLLPGVIAGKLQTANFRLESKEITTEPLSEGVPPPPQSLSLIDTSNNRVVFYTEADLEQLGARDIKILTMPTNYPSREDPLGQWGYVAIKYRYGPKQYGDWVRIMADSVISEAKNLLISHEAYKLQKLNQMYPEYAPALWQGNTFLPSRNNWDGLNIAA